MNLSKIPEQSVAVARHSYIPVMPRQGSAWDMAGGYAERILTNSFTNHGAQM
jgi:hypothetical protein